MYIVPFFNQSVSYGEFQNINGFTVGDFINTLQYRKRIAPALPDIYNDRCVI
jgi:hypothetical protein